MKKDLEQLYKNAAVALATVSSALIVLAAEGALPVGGFAVLYLVLLGASIPLLLIFYICHYFIDHLDEEKSKIADLNMTRLFGAGFAAAFGGYIFFLVNAGFFIFVGFFCGLILGLVGFYKVINA